MQTLLQDFRFGLRMLVKQPGFALIAVMTLALGIGANTAIFSVVYGVLLKPLPYKDAGAIYVARLSYADYQDLKASGQSFDWMAVWASNLYNLNFGGESLQVHGANVSPELLPNLTEPALGRFWTAEEDMQALAVISYDFWQSHFSGDPQVIGQTLRLYGTPHTIVGVTRADFQYPSRDYKLWTTFGLSMAEAPEQMANRQLRISRAVGHLKPAIEARQMQAECDLIAQRLEREYPDTNKDIRFEFAPLYERLVGEVSRALWILLGTVGFVLLIACANVASLTLGRLVSRERELAIRMALGAGRGRVLRQLLTESLLLATLGGAVGVLLAVWGLDALVSFNPDNLPRLSEVRLHWPVMFFTLGAVVLTGLISGLLPAWQIIHGNTHQSLREGGGGAIGRTMGNRMRSVLVVAEIALSLIVLAGAGLLLNSFYRLLHVDPGFVARNLLTVNLPMVEIGEDEQRTNALRDVLTRIAQVPGVQTASSGSALPPLNAQRGTRFAVQGQPEINSIAYFIAISPDYFRALGTPVREGREFTDRDHARAAKTVIINQALSRRLFPNQSPVGQRLQIINPETSNEWREIVGVVGEVRYSGLDDPGGAAIYTPFAQTPFQWSYLMIRTTGPAAALVPDVREAILAANPGLEPASFRPMEDLVSESVAQPRFYSFLLAGFALLALTLASIGIYGISAYAVSQRTREIGLRLALGARPGAVLKLILQQGMALAFTGTALGLLGAFAMTQWLRTMLYEVSPYDAWTFTLISLLLLAVAFVACWLPARRAMKVDPMIALRSE